MLHKQFIGRGVVRAILLIPYVISAVAAAYVWKWMLHSDYGLISGMLKDWGIIDENLVLLDSKDRVLPTVIVVNIWKEFSFVMIMMIAGLQTVPEELLRAARVDGAGVWQQFWHVTVPHLKNVILITTLLLFVANLNSFTLVFLMTGGGPANASQLWITADLQHRLPLARVWAGLGLLRDPLPRHAGARLVLRPDPDSGQFETERGMSAMHSTSRRTAARSQHVAPMPSDAKPFRPSGWTIAGGSSWSSC